MSTIGPGLQLGGGPFVGFILVAIVAGVGGVLAAELDRVFRVGQGTHGVAARPAGFAIGDVEDVARQVAIVAEGAGLPFFVATVLGNLPA